MAEGLSAQFSKLSVNSQNSSVGAGRRRRWFTECNPRKCFRCKEGREITVASYNVLSQNLLLRHLDLYSGCNQKHLQLDFRRLKLIEEIDRYLPDILCLQEVHEDEFYRFFKKNLSKRGYTGIYKQRPGEDNKDGCATFFKTGMFNLIKNWAIEFDQYDPNCPGRSNVAQLLALELTSGFTDQVLCVANTHLLYNPVRGDIKTTQLVILLAEMEKLGRDYPRYLENDEKAICPSIICGDLNLLPQSPLYRFLCGGRLNWNESKIFELSGLPIRFAPPSGSQDVTLHECQFVPQQISRNCRFKDGWYDRKLEKFRDGIFHRLNLISSYPHSQNSFVTSSHSEGAHNLDYILYTCHRKGIQQGSGHDFHSYPTVENGLHLTSYLEVPVASDTIVPMPNGWNGSDHFLIMSRFMFT